MQFGHCVLMHEPLQPKQEGSQCGPLLNFEIEPSEWCTAHLNEKNLSTNSPWGFEHVSDTMDPYWSCPDNWFVHRTLPTRWRCDHFSQKCPKSKLDTTFWYKKTSVTPTFYKWNSFRMHRFGAMIFLSSKTKKTKIDYY